MSDNWLVIGDDEMMARLKPDVPYPGGLRVLVSKLDLQWAGDEPEPPGPPEPPAPPSLQPYSQRDPRWKDEQYAPGYTFGGAGCYVTCIAMMLSLGGYNYDPPTVARLITETIPGAFVNGELVRPDQIPNLYPQMEWAGKVDWSSTAADMDRVHHEVERGPVIMQVDFRPGGGLDTHFVVAEGFTNDEVDDLFIIDPWDGSATRLLERYALEYWDLARAIYGLRLLRVAEH